MDGAEYEKYQLQFPRRIGDHERHGISVCLSVGASSLGLKNFFPAESKERAARFCCVAAFALSVGLFVVAKM